MCIKPSSTDTKAFSEVGLSQRKINCNNDKRLETQIQDILEAIDATEQFVANMTFQQFSQDQKTIFAIERAIGIIGATAKRLPVTLLDRYPEIAWRDIVSFADKVTYGFFEVDLAMLWQIASEEIVPIKQLMSQLLAEVETALTA